MNSAVEILRPIESEFETFKKAFRSAVVSDDTELLNQLWQYVVSKSGKQLRPQLVLLSAAMCREVNEKTIHAAVALELLHTASLMHDDVVDDSPTRRGGEAVHIRWTNKIAILAGDFVLAKVIEYIARIRNNKIVSLVAHLCQMLTSGELLQLHHADSMWISREHYFRVIEKKTAELFAACTEAGALSAGASEKQQHALRRFGLYLGMCFQMKDDILDYSDSEQLGKPTMGDVRDGKATLPLLISLERCSEAEASHIRMLAENPTEESLEEIKNFVLRYDGIGYTYHVMQEYKQKAVEALSTFHDSKYKSSLLLVLEYAINRIY